jgi:hypothetical protein
MADKRGGRTQAVDERGDVVRLGGEGVRARAEAAFPAPAPVEGDDAVALGQQ